MHHSEIARAMTGWGQNEKVSQRAFLDRCTSESGRSFERGERQLRARTGCEQSQQSCPLFDHLVNLREQNWQKR